MSDITKEIMTKTTEIVTDTGTIKLSPKTISDYLVRGNGKVTNQEIMLFLSLCKFQKLNPFLNEAYLVKFGSAQANIIVGKEVFTKRAYKEPNFKGLQAGIIIMRDGEILEIEGSFKLKNDELLGGWCKVYIADRDIPFVSKVSMQEYDKSQSTWKQIPCTMIRKVAMVQCLREAFPDLFQAMYSQEEMPVDNDIINNLDKVDMPVECEVVETETVEEKQQELSADQIKRLYTIASAHDISKEQVKSLMHQMFDKNSSKELTLQEYEDFVKEIEGYIPVEEEK